jgi:hypothetical protein
MLDTLMTIVSGIIVISIFEFLRNIKPNDNDKRKTNDS